MISFLKRWYLSQNLKNGFPEHKKGIRGANHVTPEMERKLLRKLDRKIIPHIMVLGKAPYPCFAFKGSYYRGAHLREEIVSSSV